MRGVIGAVLAAMLLGQAARGYAQPQPTTAKHMPRLGRSFLFDYGELVIEVRYLSDTKLAWRQPWTQVVDFERKVVHTTWTSPEKKLAAFQGKISAKN